LLADNATCDWTYASPWWRRKREPRGLKECTDADLLYRRTARHIPTSQEADDGADTAAIEEGYNKIGDTFVFLREDKLENVMVNGRTAADNPKYDEFRKAQASHGA
jgi:hypothetical protein